ncbi:MAG: cytochrome P450 [Polyangiales bacterium]
MTSLSILPSSRATPILGHLPQMMRDPLGFLSQLGHTHGDLSTFRIGTRRALLVNSPALIDRIVRDRNCWRSEDTRRALRSFLGDGLLSLEGPTHLRHRRLMAPAFHKERIKAYARIMVDETVASLSSWRVGETRDVRGEMMHLTLSVVSRALFGTSSASHAHDIDVSLRQILPWVARMFNLLAAMPLHMPMMHTPATRRAIRKLDRIVRKIVAERRAHPEDRGDLLSMLLAARDEDGSALSDDEICAEALTIMLAGHETTANTLTWAWHLITKHPEVQEALAAEVRGVLGDRDVSFDDLAKLPLTEQVIRETLRLYPTAWWADRVPLADIELAGHRIPKGTMMVMSVYVTQRDARFFEDPERFDPSRFEPTRAKQIPEGAYLPFGAGVHQCIGNMFALVEARLILATMVQRLVLRAQPGHEVKAVPAVTLQMADPFPVTVHGVRYGS